VAVQAGRRAVDRRLAAALPGRNLPISNTDYVHVSILPISNLPGSKRRRLFSTPVEWPPPCGEVARSRNCAIACRTPRHLTRNGSDVSDVSSRRHQDKAATDLPSDRRLGGQEGRAGTLGDRQVVRFVCRG
jgi:hypothetical protein